jgi:hypothetical protein
MAIAASRSSERYDPDRPKPEEAGLEKRSSGDACFRFSTRAIRGSASSGQLEPVSQVRPPHQPTTAAL